MSPEPFIHAPAVVGLHAFAAMAAFALGIVQLAAPKGMPSHRVLGWIWAVLMALVAASSFFVHTICAFGPFSLIHLLSILTLAMLPLGVLRARRHDVRGHARTMRRLFLAALLVAGAFTFLPGRLMHDVAFGTQDARAACS